MLKKNNYSFIFNLNKKIIDEKKPRESLGYIQQGVKEKFTF